MGNKNNELNMKKYNILFACALSQELKTIKSLIKNLNFTALKIDFLQTWVGNYNTIYSLKDYLSKNKTDFIVNIWVCGKASFDLKNDCFQVARIKNNSNFKESLPTIYFKFLDLKSILSSEKVITNTEEMSLEDYVDMESFAIDFVASKEKIPAIILKKPFDFVSLDSKKVDIEAMQNSLKDLDYISLLENISSYLGQNTKNEENYDFYKEHFSFTFSEFEIFKKLVNRYKALHKTDFKDFFERFKNLSKKEFLEIFDKV